MLKILIDASNISSGGGLNHLQKILSSHGFSELSRHEVYIVASKATASQLPSSDGLNIITPAWCEGGYFGRLLGQQFYLPFLTYRLGFNALFSPGGTLPFFSLVPMVTISQNMLPFEPDRAELFGRWSWMRLKMHLLRFSQGRSFQFADGVIFLTHYAESAVKGVLGSLRGKTVLIPHGIEPRFVMKPRLQRPAAEFNMIPLNLLYVSIQMPYKHHIELMKAVSSLRDQGLSVVLHMVGGHAGRYANDVNKSRLKLDPDGIFLLDHGHIEFEQLHTLYQQADIFVFASSCENLPNILIEAMAAGLPIACSQRGPMPEVLGDAGIYFDPESPVSIAHAIDRLATDAELRAVLAERAWSRSQAYSWDACSRDTFKFVAMIAQQKNRLLDV